MQASSRGDHLDITIQLPGGSDASQDEATAKREWSRQ